MSVASTKPAPTNKQLAAKLEGIKDALRYADVESLEAGLAEIISILEASAQPAAERTALDAIQKKIEGRLQAISNPKGSSTEDTLRWALSLFAASEQGGA